MNSYFLLSCNTYQHPSKIKKKKKKGTQTESNCLYSALKSVWHCLWSHLFIPRNQPSFWESCCISLISRPCPACCFYQLRRLGRDHWSSAFSSPLRKMKHRIHINKTYSAMLSGNVWLILQQISYWCSGTFPYSFQLWVFAYSFLTGARMLTDWWCALNLLEFCPFACVFLHCCLDNAVHYIVSASTSQWSALVTAEATSNRMNQLYRNGGELCYNYISVSFWLILERQNDVNKVA